MGLPFRLNNDAIKQITIEDGHGNVIDVPSRGYASIKEYNEAMSLLMACNDSNGKPDLEKLKTVEYDIVVVMLRHRFKDFETPKDEFLNLESGEDIGVPMLKKLYDFFSKELGIDKITPPEKQYKLIGEEEYDLMGSVQSEIPVIIEQKSTRNSRQKGVVNANH